MTSSRPLLHIAPAQAEVGMYVSAFDGSWFRHPFWRAGFVIEDEETLGRIVSSNVRGLIIDTGKGISPAEAATNETNAPADQSIADPSRPDRSGGDPEVARARSILRQGKAVVAELFNDARLGKLAVTDDIPSLVSEIARSVERSAVTLINMARLKSRDEYTYLHSVAVCALMINFARHLQMPEAQVHDMGIAGLLHDVGKMAMPPAILNKPDRLTPQEFAAMQRHPAAGAELLAACGNVPAVALDVALHHHERVDGAGYPFGLKGADISVAARMGAICDIYDALTSDRCYKDAWTPTDAIARMASWQGHCDPDLLFTFMQSLCIFPAGLLVRLRSNRLAIVLPNGRRASRAVARAFFDARSREFLPAEDVSITGSLNSDQVVGREEPAHWPFPDWVRLHADLLGGRYNLYRQKQRYAG